MSNPPPQGSQESHNQAAERLRILDTGAHPPPVTYRPTTAEPRKSTAIFAGWLLLLIGGLVCLIPIAGLSMMLVSIPVCTAAGILGIVGCAMGRPIAGVVLIFASIIAFFVFQILPWLALLIVGAAANG